MKTGQKKNNYRYRRQRTRAAQPHLQCAASPDLLKKIVNSWCRETLQLVLAGLSAYTRRRTIRMVGTVHPPGLRQHSSIPPHTVREHVSAETGSLPVPANDHRQFTQPAALRFSSFFTTPSPANHTKNLQKLSIRTPQPDPTPFYRIIPRFARALPCPPLRGKTQNTQKLSTSCDHSPTYNFQKDSREKNRRNTFAAQHCP